MPVCARLHMHARIHPEAGRAAHPGSSTPACGKFLSTPLFPCSAAARRPPDLPVCAHACIYPQLLGQLVIMAWGKPSGAGLADKLRTQDSLVVLPFRKLTDAVVADLASALAENPGCKELYASGQRVSASALREIGVWCARSLLAGRSLPQQTCSAQAALHAAAGTHATGNALKCNTNLQKLCIGHHETGDDGLAALCEGLAHNTGLKCLDWEYRGNTDASVPAVAAVLRNHPSLCSLRLARSCITDGAVGQLVAAALENPSAPLRSLNLGACELSSACLPFLTTLLADPRCQLQELVLSRSPICDGSAEHEAAFFHAAGACPTLSQLHVTGCGLRPVHAEALAAGAASRAAAGAGGHNFLSLLRADDNPGLGLGAAHMLAASLGSAAAGAASVPEHDAAWLLPTAMGSGAYAAPARHAEVDLADCGLDNAAVKAMAGVLRERVPGTGGLQLTLDLKGAKITAAAAADLAHMATLHSGDGAALWSLRLFHAPEFGDAGAVELVRALCQAPRCVKRLDLGACNLSIDAARVALGCIGCRTQAAAGRADASPTGSADSAGSTLAEPEDASATPSRIIQLCALAGMAVPPDAAASVFELAVLEMPANQFGTDLRPDIAALAEAGSCVDVIVVGRNEQDQEMQAFAARTRGSAARPA